MKMVDGPEFTANVPPTYGEINGKPLMPVLEGGAKPVAAGVRGHAKSMSLSTPAMANVANGEFPCKTDKPRPHVCLTCKRSFARLEHLKRHERSHTKEKPFECPECTRCFARRDLLLRHQQKLHMTTTASSRPRKGRRESTSSTMTSGSGKARKNGTPQANGMAAMRPRANTISHIDGQAFDMTAMGMDMSNGTGVQQMQEPALLFGGYMDDPSVTRAQAMRALPGHYGADHGLPRLNTNMVNGHLDNGLQTAPPFGGYSMDSLFSPENTVNPASLHFAESAGGMRFDSPSPFQEMPEMPMGMELDTSMEWINSGFGNELSLMSTNDTAISGSSPSANETDSPGPTNDMLPEQQPLLPHSSMPWQNPMMAKAPGILPEYMMSMMFEDSFQMGPPSPSMMPEMLANDGQFINPSYPLHHPMAHMQNMMGQPYPHSSGHPDSPSTLALSSDGSLRQASVSSSSSYMVSDQARQAIMITLAQPAMFNQRQYSQPAVSSPLSPAFTKSSIPGVFMPGVADLHRFMTAYINYLHPHFPFLHTPTLSFEAMGAYRSSPGDGRPSSPAFCLTNGGGCLILAMSAIGALYENEHALSKELFNHSKRMLTIYLEECRKADVAAAFNSSKQDKTQQVTPVWVVQAMLLNVVYGHNCGDKTSEINAHTHGAALVSLARAANLTVPCTNEGLNSNDLRHDERWNPRGEDPAWYEWRIAEEKKRTLFAVFHLSSMLTSAYNQNPALKNGEILLDLPCDEELWAADSAEAWYALGGSMAAEQKSVPFNLALSNLLTARDRHPHQIHQMSQAYCRGLHQGLDQPRAEFHASSFGCLVLMNALHNYIWETRQRHVGRQWTQQDTEDMHKQIEPALVCWQAVWAANPKHSVERPNPFGMGPLSADSIPLLDLAYLRLYVNLGRLKEHFWTRDFDEMARGIASGNDFMLHTDIESQDYATPPLASGSNHMPTEEGQDPSERSFFDSQHPQMQQLQRSQQQQQQQQSAGSTRRASRRERHLRKAAFHASHSLLLSCRTGTTCADFPNCRELPIQTAICAFQAVEVLAEWCATLQDRTGQYLGILGRDQMDLTNVPAIVLLDQEDVELLEQVEEIIASLEVKLEKVDANSLFAREEAAIARERERAEAALNGLDCLAVGQELPRAEECGFSARLLQSHARMMENSGTWPAVKVMGQCLGVQSRYMKERAERSCGRAPCE